MLKGNLHEKYSAMICVAMLIALATGCETTEKDVVAARENVREEMRETEKVRREGQQKIDEAEEELSDARHKSLRPNYDDAEVEEAKQDLEEAKKQAAENNREEQRETEQAKAEAEKVAREFEMTKARDAFVAKMNEKLESVDQRISAMKEQAEGLEGAELQKINTDVELLEVKRENLADAISEIESAELTEWESKQKLAEQAWDRIDID